MLISLLLFVFIFFFLPIRTAKNVKVVDTYPDTFTDFIEEYTFDKIPPYTKKKVTLIR